ncbi:spindle and centriole-associated protein 1 isoform X1 [Canis lupus familiaris]|uniref:Spindle and centriole-associated protein 1 n=3 Tax=Canis lupus TaxID=9612 RepID=A0A8C0PFW6_CANLF|nr:spindle and centriole-associated protein 1 isoform X1 [Canis lupus familiaris]XP_013965756.1 spindle and centriole-associated protein 1 isoform X1 [Canis lupus familiaris]XP_022269478.1 spindle and centriole-associated protein 1 isoform X1 [Canis lupus familiaris]XP_038300884.1 spindle and centriole-associated protein 1 isoform X1 [Canis lupus familiaris]XP_038300885.1 spindle and centriole-associated protein 1 isoform X1 [Canis lupus familiaris]XP_038300886.1 spindle and centriole-associat|eukprot:XP_005639552.1 spindle and centriole-associated protein 1 isoform X1 [Canis lupus familiaris]
MSLVRVNRYGPRGGGRKVLKVRKKKTSLKQEWDNTVNDLTVHRATPEDLIRRHEIHKSKNRALVHWELQEKALRRKWKKQKPEVSNLERRRLSIMKEILSDQYQMQDVLEKSDHLIAEAKDLFVDFPRRRTGFPNVTIAPDSSQGPIVVNQDPVTQAILSESVMEPQALNEVDDDEGGTVNSQSEESENEADNSLNSQSNMNVDRLLHQLKEDNSELINKLWTDIQQKIAAQSQTPSGTPSPAPPSGEQKAALNATGAVKRIHTRVQSEESTAALDSSYVVGQVLNSRKQKQLLNKVKRKPDSHSSSKQKKNTLTASTASTDLPNSNNSSLDVLKHMINEVEHEMEEYERWTGREVRGLQSSQGLTGFTLSLVGSLCRLVRYLKESELQLRKEVETRHQLEQMLGDHRELIDALTAEILFLREENTATQARLQQYMVTTDEQLISLTHAMKNCPVIKSNKESQTSERGSTSRKIIDNLEGPIVNANVSMPLVFRGEEVAEFAQEDLPVKLSQVPAPPDNVTLTNSFPAHVFEPAVLLTPPRQKSSSGFSPLQDVLRRTVQTRPAPQIPPTVEIIEKEQNWEKNTLPTGTDNQNSNEENHLFTQRWRVSHMGEDVENKAQAPFVDLSQPFCGSHSNTQQARVPEFSEEPPVLGDGQQLKTNEALIQRKDILTRIAELTLQNSAIKAHLNNIIEPGGEQGDGLRELNKQETSHVSNMTTTFPAAQPLIPSSMEERIAELNRQSMEARGKLLQLIEQQKLIGLNLSSPTVSPILSPLRAWTEGGKKTIEVSIPGAEAPESSKCSTISPTSGINTRRSSGATSNSCSPLNATTGSGRFTPVNPRAKIEKQNEEGWFALSTHVS